MQITCQLCGHKWDYKGTSARRYVTCPNCFGCAKNPLFNLTAEERQAKLAELSIVKKA